MIDLFDEKIMNQMGYPFWEWAVMGRFSITEQDLEYIQEIKKHPCFPIIFENQLISPRLNWANEKINKIVFYEQFYKDPFCPYGVKNILFSIIGLERGNIEEAHMQNLLNYRYHAVELWLDSMKQKSSP